MTNPAIGRRQDGMPRGLGKTYPVERERIELPMCVTPEVQSRFNPRRMLGHRAISCSIVRAISLLVRRT